MGIIVVDTETFKCDWIAVFLNISSGEWSVFHNDNNGVREMLSRENVIFCHFNGKHFDNFLLKAIACGASPELVKEISDFIILSDRSGWEHWFIRQNKFWFNSFDLADDTQLGTSLKHIEAHLGLAIEESEVDFALDRALTEEELERTIRYCKYDVLMTAKLLTLRKGYLDAKLNVGRRAGIPDHKALYMTNARLTAEFLGAVPQTRYDERRYEYPENLRRDLIPPEVFRFFDRMKDSSITDEELFKSKLKIMVDGAEAIIAFGGIHHAIPNYQERAAGTRVIRNFDVASLYPSLMVYCNYTSRNIPSAATFEEVYHTRLNAKASGDKHTANTLKLILNTTYGASLAKTNPLYDPLMGRSVCITGQLFILELAMRYLESCQTLRVLQCNTDGIMISLDESELPTVYRINDEWQADKRLILEEDEIKAVYQRDVNNYILVFKNGKVKVKGGLTSGIPEGGAFKINNDYVIVKQAVIDYFVNGTHARETIMSCDDIHKFQLIAKAGGGYRSVYHVAPNFEAYKKNWQKENRYRDEARRAWKSPPFLWEHYKGPRRLIQRVNRVYASQDASLGTIMKVKPDGTVGKIGGLPEHCVVDNKNSLTIDQIDREWYVGEAERFISEYLGGNDYVH